MRNRYKRDINRLVEHPRRRQASRSLRSPGPIAPIYSSAPGLTRGGGLLPVDLLWRSLEQPTDTARLWTSQLTTNGNISVQMSSTSYHGIAKHGSDLYAINSSKDLEKNGSLIANTSTDFNAVNSICAVDNAVTAQVEVWISGLNLIDEAVVKAYDSSGSFLRETVLPSGRAYSGGFIFMSVSPNFYIWGDNTDIQLKKVSDNSLVRTLSWCTGTPHEQSGLIDLTDDLAAFACYDSVNLSLVSDGSTIPVSVDMTYLEYDNGTITRGILGVQLSNETLTIVGAIRLIHYRILRDFSGTPTGTEEITRYEYDTVENYNLYLSTDRSRLKSVP